MQLEAEVKGQLQVIVGKRLHHVVEQALDCAHRLGRHVRGSPRRAEEQVADQLADRTARGCAGAPGVAFLLLLDFDHGFLRFPQMSLPKRCRLTAVGTGSPWQFPPPPPWVGGNRTSPTKGERRWLS